MESLRSSPVTIGVDIGQKHDPTAICVAEAETRADGDHFLIRNLERLALGTPYPEVAERIHRIATRVHEKARATPTVYVDATGVGQPVIDLLQGLRGPTWHLVDVTFTPGNKRLSGPGNPSRLALGKEYLASRLQALLRDQRIHLPTGPEGRALAAELRNYELRISRNGHARFGAFRSGTHDDLATALGLAVNHSRRLQ